ILFCGVTVGLGLAGLGGIALALLPEKANGILGLGRSTLFVIALLCLAAPFAYVALAAILRKPLKLWKWSFGLPAPRLAIAQAAVGTANFAFVAACLHQLVSALADAGYLD